MGCEFVLGGGFVCTEKPSSSRREKVLALTCDHGEADTRIILHGLEATKRGYDNSMVFCRDTNVFLLLLPFFGGTDHIIWMIGATERERRCYSVSTIYKTCHRMYTKIFWDFMRLQGRIPHHHLLDLGGKAVGKCLFSTLCF